MFNTTDEMDRPTEWLRRLSEDRSLYGWLLRESGSFPRAAYRLARARCRVQPVSVPIPTCSELRIAAFELARATGLEELSHFEDMVRECEEHGLSVIRPLSARAA